MSPSRPRVTHIIMSLATGGAEESLYKLTSSTRNDFEHRVISLGAPSALAARIAADGAIVLSLDLRRRGLLALWDAWRALRRDPPDVLQGWMYHGNLLAALLRIGCGGTKLAWNVRHSPNDLAGERWTIRVSLRMARLFTPHLVIYNSHDGAAVHATLGYARYVSIVIPNGVDTEKFRPCSEARERWRDRLCAAPDAKCVAMVCRFHADKGVDDFLAAVRELNAQGAACRAFLAGPGMHADNAALMAMVDAAGLERGQLVCLGEIEDVAGLLAALDVLVIASLREGMPNILLEAMACGTAIVATDVGDIARIVLEPERLVPPGDPPAIAARVRETLALGGVRSAERVHVATRFSIARCSDAYRQAYSSLLP